MATPLLEKPHNIDLQIELLARGFIFFVPEVLQNGWQFEARIQGWRPISGEILDHQ